jgi:hypothetical protein
VRSVPFDPQPATDGASLRRQFYAKKRNDLSIRAEIAVGTNERSAAADRPNIQHISVTIGGGYSVAQVSQGWLLRIVNVERVR